LNKKEVIKTLETIAVYLEIKGENSFKVSAYRRAALALESDERSMAQIEDVSKLKGIGKGTAAVIDELLETGQSTMLEEVKKEIPSGLIPLLQLPGLGGKKISKLFQELGIVDIESLTRACEKEQVRALPGFGEKTEEKIITVIKEQGTRPERLPIAFMLEAGSHIERQLGEIEEISRYSKAGSLRRLKETVRDLDFVIATSHPEKTAERLVNLEGVAEVVAKGSTKVTLEMAYAYTVNVDFRLVEPEAFVTALHHFTGSKEHNVKMRQIAKQRGEKISEYGIDVEETGELLTFEDETSFFEHFGLYDIPPELRNGKEETETFKENIPLISTKDIKGDLHMHSTWSDGANTIEEMAEAARARGYQYIAMTDHSKSLVVANGLTEKRLKQQHEKIDSLNRQYDDFTILAGIEMDIRPDGKLDYDDDILAEMDFVIASIHSSFSQNRMKIMERLKTALKNHHVDLIAHPTGRIIGRRPGYDADVEMLIELAKETNTALELNANPNRLDLTAKWLEKAQEAGVYLSINTDAHTMESLDYIAVGTSAAKKGWIRRDTVINTWGLPELRRWLNR
jgi:DNA polymerase (family 10)